MCCVKARIISWLQSGQVGAVVQGVDGNTTVITVYRNGKYIEPRVVHIPDSPSEMSGWGPDGPVQMGPQPEDKKPDEGEEKGATDDDTDATLWGKYHT